MHFTVYFDGQFWVGVAEMRDGTAVRAARHIFGGEPSSGEVLAFVQHGLWPLFDRATASVEAQSEARLASPKRLAREAARATALQGASTASQEAMRLQIEQGKQERQIVSRAERDAERERRYQLDRERAKARHRGTK